MQWNERDSTPSTSGSSAGYASPSHSWQALQVPATQDVLKSVLRARKTWKTSREGEAVWPLDLEAALLEGLKKYQPDDCRETRMLGRFPGRNRFISDYVFDKTGKWRSPKQVGSRLQQLRESCGGTQLLDLLCPFRNSPFSASSEGVDSTLNSPISPHFPTCPHTIIYIDILPNGSTSGAHSSRNPSPCSDSWNIIYASNHPRRLESINPTVCFAASSLVYAYSRFTVYSEELILHTETVPLMPTVDGASQASHILYSAHLIPKSWKVIVDSPDPTRFTIFQEVMDNEDSSMLFSATYKFRYPECVPNLPSREAYHARSDMPFRDITPYSGPASPPSTRYPEYNNNARWNVQPLENLSMHRYFVHDDDCSSY
ncbi:TEA domain-containing protein [Mycena venus]|uniref:TEA domain-containing protein n=1 Tax=Mycena venus TaxID=2733690 RepID=A0A8H7D415_9AGAR|nr:TEA domain-containing protein [Mycena venus]